MATRVQRELQCLQQTRTGCWNDSVFCVIWLLVPAWDTCFWHQSPHIDVVSKPIYKSWVIQNRPRSCAYTVEWINVALNLRYNRVYITVGISAAGKSSHKWPPGYREHYSASSILVPGAEMIKLYPSSWLSSNGSGSLLWLANWQSGNPCCKLAKWH